MKELTIYMLKCVNNVVIGQNCEILQGQLARYEWKFLKRLDSVLHWYRCSCIAGVFTCWFYCWIENSSPSKIKKESGRKSNHWWGSKGRPPQIGKKDKLWSLTSRLDKLGVSNKVARPRLWACSYLGGGEDRDGKLQQTLHLNLHGCQWPLEDGQRLQHRIQGWALSHAFRCT